MALLRSHATIGPPRGRGPTYAVGDPRAGGRAPPTCWGVVHGVRARAGQENGFGDVWVLPGQRVGGQPRFPSRICQAVHDFLGHGDGSVHAQAGGQRRRQQRGGHAPQSDLSQCIGQQLRHRQRPRQRRVGLACGREGVGGRVWAGWHGSGTTTTLAGPPPHAMHRTLGSQHSMRRHKITRLPCPGPGRSGNPGGRHPVDRQSAQRAAPPPRPACQGLRMASWALQNPLSRYKRNQGCPVQSRRRGFWKTAQEGGVQQGCPGHPLAKTPAQLGSKHAAQAPGRRRVYE